MDRFAIVELGDTLIDIDVELPKFVIGLLAAGEDAEEEDFCFGAALADEGDDFGDAFGCFLGVLPTVAGIVGADHDDGELGVFLILEVAVLETPDDVLGAVAGDAEVEGVFVGVVLFPDAFSGSFPALGDGVADEEDVVLFCGGIFIHALVALHPAASTGLGLEGRVRGRFYGGGCLG